jgi:hypothetical protein
MHLILQMKSERDLSTEGVHACVSSVCHELARARRSAWRWYTLDAGSHGVWSAQCQYARLRRTALCKSLADHSHQLRSAGSWLNASRWRCKLGVWQHTVRGGNFNARVRSAQRLLVIAATFKRPLSTTWVQASLDRLADLLVAV